MTRKRRPSFVRGLIGCGLTLASLFLPAVLARGDDEAVLFTPPGFSQPGKPATATGPESGKVAITVIDAETGKPTPCRVNVVGPDGNFYQPPEDRLTPYSLTGEWPKTGKGNRAGKAPIRYFGRFFYTTGAVTVAGPRRAGPRRGLEGARVPARARRPSRSVPARRRRSRSSSGARTAWPEFDHDSGDPHLHLQRETEADDGVIFDLLEAEDVRFGTPLMYNEPAGPYTGVREKLDYPQLRGLGAGRCGRGAAYHILSGQEYRTGTYGHLNLFLRDDLVREGESYNADNWPLYGAVGRETQQTGRHRHLRPRRLRPVDLRRLRPGRRQRRGAAPVRRLPRDRARRLVPHAEHRLPLPDRRRERLPGLPQAGRLRDLRAPRAGQGAGLRRLAPRRGRGARASSPPGRSCSWRSKGRGPAQSSRRQARGPHTVAFRVAGLLGGRPRCRTSDRRQRPRARRSSHRRGA